jgi:o-succinylbenzoate synthase
MTRATHIVSATARRLDVPMRKAFGIAGGAQEHAGNVLVTVELASGVRGYGEGAPFPAFNGETQQAVLEALDAALPAMVDWSVAEGFDLAEHLDLGGLGSARCAVETAIVDAHARATGRSLHAYFGGATTSLVTDVTITTGTPEEAAHEARAFAAFRTLKIKVGGRDVDRDVARVLAVHAARPDARLMLDANGGFSPDEAVLLASELARHDVRPHVFEQPIAAGDWDALAEVRARMGLYVALDESITSAADVALAKQRGAADAVNIKIMKSGVFEALAIARAAHAAGLDRMIGGMVETRLAMGASASIAAGLGGFTIVDLDTPLFLAEDPFDGGYGYEGDRIELQAIALGHGCTPRT